ncbi:hypothetical protein [Pseudoalteromonas sp. MMG012]|uniref:hypothetical protein n=1 Tax=Pseudoalteromonas sp. MMG012 TaxID=2822686 RepID=UPI001B39E128|nr:hypothetical protein [Pseudoalteromonas sp. MMG012]MBQ4852851.1 hypothetical protein [Pseudoalteromonas sp. MMG012]
MHITYLATAIALTLLSGCTSTQSQFPSSNGQAYITQLNQRSSKTELDVMKSELLRLGIKGRILTREISHSFDPEALISVRTTSHNISDGNSEVEVRVVKKTDANESNSSVLLELRPVKVHYLPGTFQNQDPMYGGVIKAAAKLADFYLRAEAKPRLIVGIIGMASASKPRVDAKLGSLWGQEYYTFSDVNNRATLKHCKTGTKVSKTFSATDQMNNNDLAMLRAIDLYKKLITSLDYEIRARAIFNLCYDVSPKRGREYIYADMNFNIVYEEAQ